MGTWQKDLQSLTRHLPISVNLSRSKIPLFLLMIPTLNCEQILSTRKIQGSRLQYYEYVQCTFKPIFNKHKSLNKKLRVLHISHAPVDLVLMRFCLLSSQNNKVSKRQTQSFPISIHSGNSYFTFFVVGHSQDTHLLTCWFHQPAPQIMRIVQCNWKKKKRKGDLNFTRLAFFLFYYELSDYFIHSLYIDKLYYVPETVPPTFRERFSCPQWSLQSDLYPCEPLGLRIYWNASIPYEVCWL